MFHFLITVKEPDCTTRIYIEEPVYAVAIVEYVIDQGWGIDIKKTSTFPPFRSAAEVARAVEIFYEAYQADYRKARFGA